jgi:hypothetical protein
MSDLCQNAILGGEVEKPLFICGEIVEAAGKSPRICDFPKDVGGGGGSRAESDVRRTSLEA